MGTDINRFKINFSNFCTHYVLSDSFIDKLANELNNNDIWQNLKDAFANKSDFILSIRKYPFNVHKFFHMWLNQSASLNIGGNVLSFSGFIANDWSIHPGDTPSSDGYGIETIASFTIPYYFNDFMDYEPYTHGKIYIPYLGFYDLPWDEIVGKSITIKYGVDLNLGTATFWIVCDSRVVLTGTGKVGMDVPFGTTNANDIARNNFTNMIRFGAGATSVLGGVASGQPLLTTGGIGLLASTGINAVNGNQPRYNKGQTGGGFNNLANPNSCYIVITRPKPITNTSYNALHGKPLGDSRVLSTLTGFTKVAKIHLENINTATTEEIDSIESLLKDGVIL